MSDNIAFRIATPTDSYCVSAAYQRWGYGGGVAGNDILFIAERDHEIVAAVRKATEHGIVLLRGMQVAPEHRRLGIGRKLLELFVAHLGNSGCYCVPYRHLERFYANSGFATLAEDAAPPFLRERVTSYRARGLDVILMYRPPHP